MKKLVGQENAPYWKMFFFLYLCGFLAGIVFANLAWRYRIEDLHLIRKRSFLDSAAKEVDYENYFHYLLPKRLLFPAVILILGLTILGTVLVVLRILWLGFLTGTLMSIFVLQNGILGLGYFMAGILPQMLWNIPLAALVFLKCYQMSMSIWKGEKFTLERVGNYFLWVIGLLICLIWGCLLEAYLNPRVIQFIFQNVTKN